MVLFEILAMNLSLMSVLAAFFSINTKLLLAEAKEITKRNLDLKK
jgi:hypothetical protein